MTNGIGKNGFGSFNDDSDDPGSPLDALMSKSKKRRIPVAAAQAPTLKVQTAGLSLMQTVQGCDEGMSPLMERFTAKKAAKGALKR